ncbi:fungal transcriptional regulatory protein [Ophiostoma piceae UAMH 11346]|uniref:Fungal transcriptional regulatory protein n=1 Tax=Ophiostoma piceae (strain UAMH 11346) TaxID=1262450 RepID=S3CDR2_OPHP1|nr:fungal transcriptional regulatory protein [Ophiostoma piceae UAMH 11346]
MEALLREAGDGLALGSSGDEPQCRSPGELKNKIAQLFGGKVSDTRAERVSASFEIPADIVLNLSDVSHDPNSAGTDQDVTAVQGSSLARSFFTVREVVVSQVDAGADPIAQKAVAAFLMIHVRQADGSVWGVQSTSRATQGWTVSYVCQHSMACWKQANTRRKTHIVGLSTTDDMLDIASLARPAFDCRGVVNITFSRFSRSVVVKYEHTNFHRSVSDLVKLFPPPRPPSPLLVPAPALGSTNKRTKATMDGQDASGITPKRKKPRKSAASPAVAPPEGDGAVAPATGETAAAEAPATLGLETTPSAKPKKPRKPRKPSEKKLKTIAPADGSAGAVDIHGPAASSAAQGVTSIATAAVDAMMDLGIDVNPSGGDLNDSEVADALLQHLHEFPEDNAGTAAAMMDALAEHTSASEANWQLNRELAASAATAAEASPEDSGATTEQTFSNDQAAVATASSHAEVTGNTETERPRPYMLVTDAEVSNARKATAIKLLSDRSVDPGTLTHEQFCTFANQAPVLQKESLELLAHYGAERLAIVPASNNRSNSNTQSPTPAPPADGAGLAQASTTPQPTQQTHVPPPAPAPVPAPAPAPPSPAKPIAKKKPARKTQSKAVTAAAAAAPAPAPAPSPDNTARTAQDTDFTLPGLRGGDSAGAASWSNTQLQQQNTAPVVASDPAPAKRGSRRMSNTAHAQSTATAPSTTPVPRHTLPLPTQVSPVPLPATASVRESFASAPVAPVSAIVQKPAKVPRKPRAPRQKNVVGTGPRAADYGCSEFHYYNV